MTQRFAIRPRPEDMVVSDLLAGLDAATRAELSGWLTVQEEPDGAVIFREGDPGDALFIVLEGAVAIESADDETGPLLLALGGPGDVFGEMALLDGRRRSATVRARGRARLLKLDRLAHLRMQEEKPAVAARLMAGLVAVLSSRLRESNRSLLTLFATGQALASGLPADEIAEQVLARIADAIPAAESGLVAVWDGDARAFVPSVAFGVSAGFPSTLDVARDGPLMRALDSRREAICLGESDALARELSALGASWLLVTELRRGDERLGFIALLSRSTLCPFTAAHQVMLGVAADQTAGALALSRRR